MDKCKFENLIDGYLLNKLGGNEKDRFEEHYFNCPNCFEKMAERDEMIRAVKRQGQLLVANLRPVREPKPISWPEKAFSFFAPRPWAVAAVSAAVLLIVIFGIIPSFRKSPTPQFYLNDENVVRGEMVSLISPIIDVRTVPAYFEWKKLGNDVEYKIYVYNSELLWTASTKETRIAVPEDIKKLMIAGQKYSWQVRAFSPKGTLIAVSSRVQFQVSPSE